MKPENENVTSIDLQLTPVNENTDENGNVNKENDISNNNSNGNKKRNTETKVDVSTGVDIKSEPAKLKSNFIHNFLYGSAFGLVINVILMVICAYFAFFSVEDGTKYFRERVMGFKDFQYLICFLFVEHVIVLLLFFPLTRLYRTTTYYWFIGVIASICITICAVFDYRANITTGYMRFVASTEVTRVTMKIVALLLECNKSEETFKKTTLGTFTYFMFAPTLIYKVNYGKTKRVRFSILYFHVAWFVIASVLMGRLFYQYIYDWAKIDFGKTTVFQLILQSYIILISFTTTYVVVVYFIYFENWCGFYGELLRFPNRRLFGPVKHYFNTRKVARAANAVVSDFFNTYIFKPIVTMTKSTYTAIFFVWAISIFYHEWVMAYILHQIVAPNMLMMFVAPLILAPRKLHPFFGFVRFCLLITGVTVFSLSHMLEYFAWNESTFPGYENSSKWRVIPLCYYYTAEIVIKFTKNMLNL